ncbi:MAG TPA: 50S ribosomal protein L25 [Candidatus Saccharimonadales bacterium]|nr:50S ribosomal protein L25 [Candidatus Saccharimonadales bacterium]
MADVDAPVKLETRQVLGKGLGRLRADGTVPAVIHNFGQSSIHVMGSERELVKVYREAGKHHPLNLEVGSDKYLALIKDAHFDPVKRRLQHVVFQAIKQDEKVEAEVPIRLEGDIPAEKIGLMVLHQLDHVEVEALPKDLPDELVVNADKLAELHDEISVADLIVPQGVTVLTDAEHPIARVVETKAMISEEEAEGELTEEEAEAAAEEVETSAEKEGGNAPKGSEHEAAGQQAPGKPGE